MTDFFLHFHSGWRYVVIVVTVLVALFFVYALITQRTSEKQEKNTLRIWAGVMDLQLLPGILLLVNYLLNDKYYDKLVGHFSTAIIAVLIAHVPAFYRRLNGDPPALVRRLMGAALPVIVIVLVIVAVSAIDRPLFGS